VLRPNCKGTLADAGKIHDHVKTKLAAHEHPRAVEFVSALPMTTTGKIMRGELRKREAERNGGD
jgi:acetyl-CoA synthetase